MNKNKRLILTLTIISVLGLALVYYINKPKRYTPQQIWEQQYQKKKERRKKGYNKADKPDKFTEYYNLITTPIGKNGNGYEMGYQVKELSKAIKRNNSKSGNFVKNSLNFVSRGPANIGGRTRAILIDPDDEKHKTWIVGSASGGIWRTTNEGNSWENLSDQFTNLGVNALVMSESNHNVIYAGTGESFPGSAQIYGNGIWKTTDKGETWKQLKQTGADDNFGYVNRLVVDPTNENILLAATETGIFRSEDGGEAWQQVHTSSKGVENLVAKPDNFNILYAGEHSVGILRSVDAGKTWKDISKGLGGGTRFEISVSPANTNYVYVSKNMGRDASEVFVSNNGGDTWAKYNDDEHFLGGQGDYDNIITAHPYNEKEVYVGGVNLWHLTFDGAIKSMSTIVDAYSENTDFLTFVDFSGGKFPKLGGGLDTTDFVERTPSDWVSVEIRFGAGLKQKAHRFTVPDNATSGVASYQYTYADYVDVPFQVWDVTNNRQLMVSFRDQEKDGKFNLYERKGDGYGKTGREYIFVNAEEYDPNNPSPRIAQQGKHLYKCLYMFWAMLSPNKVWQPNNLPNSKIVVEYGKLLLQNGSKVCIGDAYGEHGGYNQYQQGQAYNSTSIPGLHPDHHALVIIPRGKGKFTMVSGSDGGIAISKNEGKTFRMRIRNYVTTQFYGVAKHPTQNDYIGGMQDNGTWMSKTSGSSNYKSKYYFMLGGDGFECLWHAKNPKMLLGSIYNNAIWKTTDGGRNWNQAQNGITQQDGPFLTRLSASVQNPDLIFAVGNTGVYRSDNFGDNWDKINISDNWTYYIKAYSSYKVTSAHNVEVSLADGNIVWTGGGMKSGVLDMHVSTDEGKSFKKVNQYGKLDMNAHISGIATHPTDANTAYLLFSNKGKPKILRTTDLGNSWEDISGFETNNTSNNGFPDVVVHSLVVMPHKTNVIWVGTDIGMFESEDNGKSWHVLESNLPRVSIYDMHIFGTQLVMATHGRGVWTLDIPGLVNIDSKLVDNTTEVKVYPNPNNGEFYIELGADNSQVEVFNSMGVNVFSKKYLYAGKYQVVLPNAKAGTYIIKTRSGNKVSSNKIIVR